MPKIFVQMAAYRDPELVPTVRDCLAKAEFPDDLRFGICHQHDSRDEWDTLEDFCDDSRFRIVDVDWRDSKGRCWARWQIQQLYGGEEYTLHLDSHHRFVRGWDAILVDLAEALVASGVPKPILTTYATPYDPAKHQGPEDDHKLPDHPLKIVFDRFTPGGAALCRPHHIQNYRELEQPLPATFLSTHFLFTLGRHVTEVPHDPEYYVHGDEISLAARSHTHGYDLFHPHRTILWHEYGRKGRRQHWDDHVRGPGRGVEKDWWQRDQHSLRRNRVLFGMEEGDVEFGRYGFGDQRTLRDYEEVSGLDFKRRRQKPRPGDSSFDLRIEWDPSHFVECGHADSCYLGILDDGGSELHRTDLTPADHPGVFSGEISHLLVRFSSASPPSRCVLWLASDAQGWLTRVEQRIWPAEPAEGQSDRTGWSYPLKENHAKLLQLQLAEISRVAPPWSEGMRARATRQLEDGLSCLKAGLDSAGIDHGTLARCLEISQEDSRFTFLEEIPSAAGTGVALGRALERGLYGDSLGAADQMNALLGAFNVVLDGLVDDAWEVFEPERDRLLELTSPDTLLSEAGMPPIEGLSRKHPVVALMYWIAAGWAKLARAGDAWTADDSVRNSFADAVQAAVSAELESVRVQRITDEAPRIGPLGRTLYAKSADTMRVHGLAPVCHRGWPAGFDQERYAECLRALGRYGGWMDDVRDVIEDLESVRWNNVLLQIAEPSPHPTPRTATAWLRPLVQRLASPEVRQSLVGTGRDHYLRLTGDLTALGLSDDLHDLISDVTRSYLDVSSP